MSSTFLVLLFAFFVSCNSSPARAEAVEVYYFQIGVETLIPITTVDAPDQSTRISEQATSYALVNTANRDFKRLRTIIRDAPVGGFEEYAVRVMLVFPDSSRIYIDNFGGVWTSDGEYALGPSRLKEAQEIFERITEPRLP